ncbi:MAG: hypothetical protein K6G88_02755 [Lachnospiraceae bacterium]|nr:hypothetical protein [Lachnospiraceae bacterium]
MGNINVFVDESGIIANTFFRKYQKNMGCLFDIIVLVGRSVLPVIAALSINRAVLSVIAVAIHVILQVFIKYDMQLYLNM